MAKREYLVYEAEDFLLDDSFLDYCLGKHEEHSRFWQEWIANHPEKNREVQKARELYMMLNGDHTASGFAENRQAFREAFEKHIGLAGTPQFMANTETALKAPAFKRILLYISGAAACILIFWLAQKRYTADPAPQSPIQAVYVRSSKPGEKKMFQLPDGSNVMLNGGSTFTIAKDFNQHNREVTLDGEAYFDVAHDSRKPFIIHTSTMSVKVLGTVFNIRAYAGDKSTETSLLRGSVEVTLNNEPGKKIILHPNEKIVLNNGAGAATLRDSIVAKTTAAKDEGYKIAKLTYDASDSTRLEVSWTQNRLAFNDNSLDEIARQLERWYNLSVTINDEEIKNYRFTAIFERKNITQVLDALQLSRHFNYRVENENKIVIEK